MRGGVLVFGPQEAALLARVEALGYRARPAHDDGEHERALVGAERPGAALLIADASLERWLERLDAHAIPVVVLYAEGTATAVRDGLERHVFGALREPFDDVVLASALASAIERGRLAWSLRRSVIALDELQQVGQVGSWTWEVATNESWTSPQLQRIYGKSEEELGANALDSFLECVQPDERAAVRERIDAAYASREPVTHEFRIVRPDGVVRSIRSRMATKRDAEGAALSMLGVSQDITDAVERSAALSRSEERFRTLFEHAADGIVICDLDGRITDANPALCAMLGYTREELLGMKVDDAYAPTEPKASRVDDVALGNVVHHSRILRRKDGSEFTGEVVATLFAGSHVQATVRDVSERLRAAESLRRTEENLREVQKLDAIGQLAGGVAHDFNNLLTVILSMAGVLEELVAGEPESLQLVRDIQQAGTRAGELTRQLLAFARRQTSAPRVVDLNTQLGAFTRFLERVIGEDVKLRIELGANVGAVRIDPSHLEQILLNLAVNARDAMKGVGGTLTLRTWSGRDPDVGRTALLEVIDTGHGMDEATRAHVFEPFFTTKDVGEGTGLGLATVYGIVKQAGADIQVRSALGEGTTFRLAFPSAVEASTTLESRRPQDTGGTETVLVVEDDARVRAVTARTLAAAGYHVVTAEDAADALRISPTLERLDLLVSDVMMQGLKGPELAGELLKQRPGLPVLFVSGYAPDPEALRPFGRLLPKPFTRATLLAEVRAALDGLPRA